MDYPDYLAYFTADEPRPSFRLLDGTGRVMISAPHSVAQTRHGRSKSAEVQAGILACLLHDRLHCPVIYKARNWHDDANYDPVSPYKKRLCRYVRSRDIRYLLDLHQLAPWRAEDIELGTGHGKNIVAAPQLAEVARRHFALLPLRVITTDTIFSASYPYTVCAYVAARCPETACLQIELNSRLVCEGYEDNCFSQLLGALEQIVTELNEG